ncbi:MAG: hypothetical protein ACXAEU_17210 [Candidatus Hodarchaeales archaeon]|jgi:hypothetical protein
MAVVARKKEQFALAECLSADAVGDCVRITGAAVDGFYQVAKVDPTVTTSSYSVAVIVSKYSDTVCMVQLYGSLDSVFSGLTPGKPYWVGTNGRPNENLQSNPGGLIHHQRVGVALTDDVLLMTLDPPITRRG